MPATSWAELKETDFPTSSITLGVQKAFVKLDAHHQGLVGKAEIRQLLKDRTQLYRSVVSTIVRCAQIIKADPRKVTNGLSIMRMCEELLNIDGKFGNH